MAAKTYNMSIDQGETYIRTITWKQNGSLVDLTGYTARMKVKDTYGGTTYLTLTDASGITLGGTAGTIVIKITDAQTSGLVAQDYVYDLELVSGSGDVSKLIKGVITVNPEVTT